VQSDVAHAADSVRLFFGSLDMSPHAADVMGQDALVQVLQQTQSWDASVLTSCVSSGAALAAERFTKETQHESADAIDHVLVWLDTCVLGALRRVQSPVMQSPSLPVRACAPQSLVTPCGSFQWPSVPSTMPKRDNTCARVSYAVLSAALGPLMPACFDIITQWPESKQAAHAWAAVLKREPKLRPALIHSLQAAFKKRLLRVAVPTQTVLDVYSLALACLLEVDPSGIVCDAATEPVQHTLRERSDTVKCVVRALTTSAGGPEGAGGDEGGVPELTGAAADLKAALAATPDAARGMAPGVLTQADRDFTTAFKPLPKQCPVSQRKGACLQISGGGLDTSGGTLLLKDISWSPESREMTTGGVRASRSDDLIGTLTALYGTAELFVAEYRSQLRNRLLASDSFDVESDIGVLELLKMRFGDAVLHSAEVMLNDIAESRRALVAVRRESCSAGQVPDALRPHGVSEEQEAGGALAALLLSEQYWPVLKRGPAVVDANAQVLQPDEDDHSVPVPCPRLHPSLQHKYDEYSATWEALKAPRHLRWLHHLGCMTISVAPPAGGPATQVTASPLEVSVLLFVNGAVGDSGCAVQDIAGQMQLQPSTVMRLAKTWMQHGIAQSSGSGEDMHLSIVKLGHAETFAAAGDAAPGPAAEDEEDELSDEAKERMAMCEQFVYGMLRNMGTLQLAMVHNNLKMFMSMSDGAGKQLQPAETAAHDACFVLSQLNSRKQNSRHFCGLL